MTAATSNEPAASADFSKERVICEFWSSAGESNAINELAGSLPLGLGLLIYAPMYVFKALNIGSSIRYTLTNARVRVDKGVMKKTINSVPLADIVDARVVDFVPFTRTGNIELLGPSGIALKLHGLQNPAPAAATIMDAVRARAGVQKVLADQKAAKAP